MVFFLVAAAPRRSVLWNDLLSHRAASTAVLWQVRGAVGMCIFVGCGDVTVSLKGVVCDSPLTADHESARDVWGVER